MALRRPDGIVSRTMTVTTDTGLQTAIASPRPRPLRISASSPAPLSRTQPTPADLRNEDLESQLYFASPGSDDRPGLGTRVSWGVKSQALRPSGRAPFARHSSTGS